MNDATAQLLVDRLAAGLPEPSTVPIPELLRDGQRSRLRRRRTAVGAVALAVTVVVAGWHSCRGSVPTPPTHTLPTRCLCRPPG
jgi:hypothetical protein